MGFSSYFLLLNWSQRFQWWFSFDQAIAYTFFIVSSSIFIAVRVRILCIQFQISQYYSECICMSGSEIGTWYSHLIHNNIIFWRRVNFTKTTIAVQAMSRCESTAHNNCAQNHFFLSHFYLDSFYILYNVDCTWRHPSFELYTIHYITLNYVYISIGLHVMLRYGNCMTFVWKYLDIIWSC